MSRTTRRNFMIGSTATVAASILTPAHAIPRLASPETLTSLAARGLYASVPNELPADVCSGGWKIYLNGELFEGSVWEIYAPGDETGWAVVYKDKGETDGIYTGDTKLVTGRWRLERGS